MPYPGQFSSPAPPMLPRLMGKQSQFVLGRPPWCLIAILGMVLAFPAKADIPAGERAVLLALYGATGGANWTGNAGWFGPPGTECIDWQGVTCDEGHNHVTKVRVHANNLVGSLPAISGLTELEEFQVQNNHLTGRIPALAGLTKLRLVVLSDNQLSGPIPALSGLTALVTFAAHSNQLTGSMPQLTGLSSLLAIEVHSNRLSGSVPPLDGLVTLRYVLIYNNQLSGYLPDVPHPSALQDARSLLCLPNGGNGFMQSPNAGWDSATGTAPWYLFCGSAPDPVSSNGFD